MGKIQVHSVIHPPGILIFQKGLDCEVPIRSQLSKLPDEILVFRMDPIPFVLCSQDFHSMFFRIPSFVAEAYQGIWGSRGFIGYKKQGQNAYKTPK
jgi:hypothetical protein